MREKNEKIFWDMEILGNRRKKPDFVVLYPSFVFICKMRIYNTSHGQTISEDVKVLSVFFLPVTQFFLSSCKKLQKEIKAIS